MSSSMEELYQKLISSGLSEEQLEKELERRMKEFGDFMTKQGILFIIAKEHGINPYDNAYYKELDDMMDCDEFTISIAGIKDHMTNIVLLGKIRSISQPKEFLRKDSSIGRVSSFLVSDLTGNIKIVLWEDNAQIVEQELFKKNQIVRIIGGYSKVGKDNSLEVHLGKRGKIMIAPKDVSKKSLEQLEQIYEDPLPVEKKVSQISIKTLLERYRFIKVIEGEVKIHEFKEITKKNGEKSFLLKLLISDSSTTIPVSIWGMNAVECLKILENGLIVHITNLSVKDNPYTQEKELIFTKKSALTVL